MRAPRTALQRVPFFPPKLGRVAALASLAQLEEEEAHFATELVQMVPYEVPAADEEKASTSWRLANVPQALTDEIQGFADYRMSPLKCAPTSHANPPHTPIAMCTRADSRVPTAAHATARRWWT